MKHPVKFHPIQEMPEAVDFVKRNSKEFEDFLDEHDSQIREIMGLSDDAKEGYKKSVAEIINMFFPYEPNSYEIAHLMFFPDEHRSCAEKYREYLGLASKQMKKNEIKDVAARKDLYETEANEWLEKESVLETDIAKYFFKMGNLQISGLNYPEESIEYQIEYVLTSMAISKLDKQLAEVEKDEINIDQFLADTLTKFQPWLEKRIGKDIESLFHDKVVEFDTEGKKPGLKSIARILKNEH